VEAGALAGVKKKAETEGRTIAFIDESGLKPGEFKPVPPWPDEP
jgi:hypothetical protein